MIDWLRRLFSNRPSDPELEALSRIHEARVAQVPTTRQRAREVSRQIVADGFHKADGVVFKVPGGRHARS